METESLKHILSLKAENQTVLINAISQYILERNKCFEPKNAMLGKDVYAKYTELRKNHPSISEIAQNSFGVTLSLISHSSTSPIKSAGKKQGYYVDKDMLNPDAAVDTVFIKLKEKDLYPILTEWLRTKADKAIDVSKKRGAKKWQNADILGVSFINDLGREDFELHAIEVKILHTNWRVDLFQAVSHSRFANRSYFAFLLKSSDVDKLENDFIEYAYQFGIGLVAIVIKDDYWYNILGKKQDLALSDTDDDSICEIREICFAPHHSVNPAIRTVFLTQAFDVHTIQDLRNNL